MRPSVVNREPSAVSRHLFRLMIALVLGLMLAGCGLISIGVSNSPEWCPDPQSKAC